MQTVIGFSVLGAPVRGNLEDFLAALIFKHADSRNQQLFQRYEQKVRCERRESSPQSAPKVSRLICSSFECPGLFSPFLSLRLDNNLDRIPRVGNHLEAPSSLG